MTLMPDAKHSLIHTLALYFAFNNFCRIHEALKVTPAMAAGITHKLGL
jgi:hypothetical protein